MTEKILKAKSGLPVILLNILAYLLSIGAMVFGSIQVSIFNLTLGIPFLVIGVLYSILGWIFFLGIRKLEPGEAIVVTLFGKYQGTIKEEGLFFVNPFSVSVNPAAATTLRQSNDVVKSTPSLLSTAVSNAVQMQTPVFCSKKISLKSMTLNNNRQKINDFLGNPVEIAIAVIWRVEDTAKAVFNVDNFKEFLSLQCDVSLRNIVKLYPYDITQNVDTTGDGQPDDGSLRGSSEIVAQRIKDEIQSKVSNAGIIIEETKITYLAYSQEIAAAMLQRQQATALVDARKTIVDGAVGMVELALDRLDENGKISLDDERKAAMISNLLVVLCGNKDAQPIVNSGSLY